MLQLLRVRDDVKAKGLSSLLSCSLIVLSTLACASSPAPQQVRQSHAMQSHGDQGHLLTIALAPSKHLGPRF